MRGGRRRRHWRTGRIGRCFVIDGPNRGQRDRGTLVAIFVAVLVLRGRESEPPIDKAFAAEEAMFNELAASISAKPPSKPPTSATGEMYDGY